MPTERIAPALAPARASARARVPARADAHALAPVLAPAPVQEVVVVMAAHEWVADGAVRRWAASVARRWAEAGAARRWAARRWAARRWADSAGADSAGVDKRASTAGGLATFVASAPSRSVRALTWPPCGASTAAKWVTSDGTALSRGETVLRRPASSVVGHTSSVSAREGEVVVAGARRGASAVRHAVVTDEVVAGVAGDMIAATAGAGAEAAIGGIERT
jgi:hypothetical protein